MRRLPWILACVVASVAVSQAATRAAETPDDSSCRAEVEQLCSELTRGGAAWARCLKEHEDSLPAECRARLGERRVRMEQTRAACEGGLARCLREHRDALSQECAAMLTNP